MNLNAQLLNLLTVMPRRRPERRPRLTIVSENYWPEVASTAQLITDLAEGLSAWFEVEVLTAQPRYHGKYGSRDGHEVHNSVEVRRLWSTRFDKKNRLGRLANWFSFLASVSLSVALRWQRRTYLFVTNPPTAPWATLIARLQRQRSFALVYDLYPDLAVALRVIKASSPLAQAFDKVNIAALRSADGVIGLGADMQERLQAKLGAGSRIEVIPNWADGNLISPRPKAASAFAREHGLVDSTVFLYAGNLGLFQDLEVLIHAVEGMDRRSRVRLVFVGDGAKRPIVEAAARRSERVLRFDYLPYGQLGDLYAAADVGMIAIESGVERVNMPSKTYSILASGRPFIAVCGGSNELRRLADLGAGLVVPNDAAAVREAMRQLHRNASLRRSMGAAARQLFEDAYTRELVLARYTALLLGQLPDAVPEVAPERQAA